MQPPLSYTCFCECEAQTEKSNQIYPIYLQHVWAGSPRVGTLYFYMPSNKVYCRKIYCLHQDRNISLVPFSCYLLLYLFRRGAQPSRWSNSDRVVCLHNTWNIASLDNDAGKWFSEYSVSVSFLICILYRIAEIRVGGHHSDSTQTWWSPLSPFCLSATHCVISRSLKINLDLEISCRSWSILSSKSVGNDIPTDLWFLHFCNSVSMYQ